MQIFKYIVTLTLFQAALISCSNLVGKKPAQPFVCPCEYNFQPVCGSDGVTYTNQCLLECHNAATGEAPVTASEDCAACECLDIDLPVCSVDGITYPNECELSCENERRIREKKPLVFLAYRAACLGPPCACGTVASPVCGSDDILYRNLCELECAQTNAKARQLPLIEFKNVGACLDGCQCPAIELPVCGSDGVEYRNLCEVACQNRKQTCSLSAPITLAPENVCLPCACTSAYDPVCGSDGKQEPRTFPNECELNCEAKRTKNPSLRVLRSGCCSNCFCTGEQRPVCGTDRKTYENECELRCANERDRGGSPVSVLYGGPCSPAGCDCAHCPPSYQPACGSDGVTYWNLCWLNCNSRCCKDPIFLAKRGSCSL